MYKISNLTTGTVLGEHYTSESLGNTKSVMEKLAEFKYVKHAGAKTNVGFKS